MGSIIKLNIKIVQPGFYEITEEVKKKLQFLLKNSSQSSGLLHLFCLHTSCALLINESFDDSAKKDLETFLNYLAPENLPFIRHTLEGPDDSPAHMKTALLHQNIALMVDNGELILGRWQGIFLAEFRSSPHNRELLVKFQED